MSFNFGQDKFYRKVSFEVAQGGGSRTFTFKCHYLFKTNQEVQQLIDKHESVTDFLMDVVTGWEDFNDAENKKVEYSPEEARNLFDTFASARSATKEAFINALAGSASRVKT